jgi:predicted acylesterase/phospholipase RssA
LFVQSCASLPERNPLPEESYEDALVLGRSDLRFWGDERHPASLSLSGATPEELRAIFPDFVGNEINVLAISGGGENGAFAAGLLNGWTASGTRPGFNVVTGISTGALIAPFAYLGPAYDTVIEQVYTQYSSNDLIRPRRPMQIIRNDSGFDTAPLRSLIAEYVDETVMGAIAVRYRRGNLLFIGTTNLDAGRPVTWDIGAIASSGNPGALGLIHDIMLASASIPVAFSPVLIEAEADGQTYDEMHVDGGVSRQSFLFTLSADADSFDRLNPRSKRRAFVIRNSKLESEWEAVDRKILPIAGRSAMSMVRTQGVGDLYREYVGAQKYDFDFNLAFIPGDFEADAHELFDREYMKQLYELGYEMAADGYPWEKYPPGINPL